jgi:hypothetical protein
VCVVERPSLSSLLRNYARKYPSPDAEKLKSSDGLCGLASIGPRHLTVQTLIFPPSVPTSLFFAEGGAHLRSFSRILCVLLCVYVCARDNALEHADGYCGGNAHGRGHLLLPRMSFPPPPPPPLGVVALLFFVAPVYHDLLLTWGARAGGINLVLDPRPTPPHAARAPFVP